MNAQPQNQNPAQNPVTPVGQIKVDVFSIGKDLKALTDKLKLERETLTKTFDQTRKGVMLLADLYKDGKGNDSPSIDVSAFEQAGIDEALVLKTKIAEQVKYIDSIALEHGIKSNLSEQFTHYDDRHTGAEAKNELLEDIETQLMSKIYNQINDLRNKVEADEAAAANTPIVQDPPPKK